MRYLAVSDQEHALLVEMLEESLGFRKLAPVSSVDVEDAQAMVQKAIACEDIGAWQCAHGHMFRYEPPPAYPPFCVGTADCEGGRFRWVFKDEVTARDWI